MRTEQEIRDELLTLELRLTLIPSSDIKDRQERILAEERIQTLRWVLGEDKG